MTRSATCCCAQGDRDGALTAYRAALAIAETLARRDPGNTEWQRDLSVSHDKIGDVLLSQGDLDGALAAYRAALAIRETLARRDPGNTAVAARPDSVIRQDGGSRTDRGTGAIVACARHRAHIAIRRPVGANRRMGD